LLKLLINLFIFCFFFTQDSIPRYSIIYSQVYHNLFAKEKNLFDLELLQRENEVLHQYINKYLNSVLDIIPIYSGYRWKKNYHINIYPSRSELSFSHPLTLMEHSNKEFLFYNLVHELVHHNIDEGNFKNRKMYEAYCDKVAAKVLSFLPDRFHNLYKLSVYYPDSELYNWDIDTLTVKEWLDFNIQHYDSAFVLYQRLTNALLHTNELNISYYLDQIKKSFFKDLQEESYFNLISYFRDKGDFKKSIQFIAEYRNRYPNATYLENMLFILSEIFQFESKNQEYLSVLDTLKNLKTDINNYLDNALLSNANYHESNGKNGEAMKNLFYIVETLPNGKSRFEAYKSIGRIFLAEKLYHFSEIAYIKAVIFAETNEKKAETIFEFSKFISKKKKEELKRLIIKILGNQLKPETEKKLEKIYFDLYR
jgi:hypothetical protein